MTRYSLNIPKYCIINTVHFGIYLLATFTGRKSNLCDYFICPCWRLIWEECQISSQLCEAFMTATRSQQSKLSPAITQLSFRRPISILTVKGCYLALVFSLHWFPENPLLHQTHGSIYITPAMYVWLHFAIARKSLVFSDCRIFFLIFFRLVITDPLIMKTTWRVCLISVVILCCKCIKVHYIMAQLLKIKCHIGNISVIRKTFLEMALFFNENTKSCIIPASMR